MKLMIRSKILSQGNWICPENLLTRPVLQGGSELPSNPFTFDIGLVDPDWYTFEKIWSFASSTSSWSAFPVCFLNPFITHTYNSIVEIFFSSIISYVPRDEKASWYSNDFSRIASGLIFPFSWILITTGERIKDSEIFYKSRSELSVQETNTNKTGGVLACDSDIHAYRNVVTNHKAVS